jgi:hypothetical protein
MLLLRPVTRSLPPPQQPLGPKTEIGILGQFLLLPDVQRSVLASSWSMLLLNLSRIETADFVDIQVPCMGTKIRQKTAPIPRNR